MQRKATFPSIAAALLAVCASAPIRAATIGSLDAPVYSQPSAFGSAIAILRKGRTVSVQPAAGDRPECWLRVIWGEKPARTGFVRCEDLREPAEEPAPGRDSEDQEPIDRFLTAVGVDRYTRMSSDEGLRFLFNTSRIDENDAGVREAIRQALRLEVSYDSLRACFLPYASDPRILSLTEQANRPLMRRVAALIRHTRAFERAGGLTSYLAGVEETPASAARMQLVAQIEKASGDLEFYLDVMGARVRGAAMAQKLTPEQQEQLVTSVQTRARKQASVTIGISELHALAPLSDDELAEYGRFLESSDWQWMNGIARGVVLEGAEAAGKAMIEGSRTLMKAPEAGSARAFYEQGVRLIDDGKDGEAIRYLDEAIRLQPDYAIAYYKRGNAYRNIKQGARSADDYTQAVRYDPSMALAYVNRGLYYRSLGQNRRALDDFSRAIQANPEVDNGWAARGMTYDAMGNYTQAIADYSQAIRLSPLEGSPWTWRGMSHGQLHEWKRSSEDCRISIKLGGSTEDPGDDHTCEGRALEFLKDYRGAVTELTRAIELLPPSAQPYRDRGWSFEAQGRIEDALKDYNKGLELDPRDDYLHCRRSGVLDKMGRGGEANADRGYCATANVIH